MSKSLGNVVAPGDIINGVKGGSKQKASKGKKGVKGGSTGSGFSTPYGADVARLWVGSSDYTRDISLSPVAVGKSGDAVRKLRNTARFLLANTVGYVPPAAVAVASPSLTPLQRQALTPLDLQRGFADASPGVLQDFKVI
jgi:isoleucyl-tRNA synthetase